MKNTMIAFLFLGIFFIASWGVMFSSLLFRWTFASCPFFSSFTVVAFVIMIASWVLGVICWRNFNEGLAYHRSSNALFFKLNLTIQHSLR